MQDFNVPGTGTSYTLGNHIVPPAPPAPGATLINDVPPATGRFLRLAYEDAVPSQTSIAFDRAQPGAFDVVLVDFDFRIAPVDTKADGMGFVLLNTSPYPAGGVAPEGPLFAAEEPGFVGSLGIGFDVYKHAPSPQDSGDVNDNHISVHFDRVEKREFDATELIDLARGDWIHARIVLRPGGGVHDVSVILTPRGGRAVTIVDRFVVDGFNPYEGRAYFAARSGGESAHHDLDNVRIQFLSLSQSVVSLSTSSYSGPEGGVVEVTVARAGNLTGAGSVQYATANLTATAGSDYQSSSGTLSWAPEEATTSFVVPLLDDALLESREAFQVLLSDPIGTLLGGPVGATIVIADDETVRVSGSWMDRIDFPVIPIHIHLMPTGKVVFFEGGGENAGGPSFTEMREWDPSTGLVSRTALPGYDIFCSGHSLLANGTLFVTGGHNMANNVGLAHASTYNAVTNSWTRVPDMNKGRWYPTNTTLANGEVLVVSGDTTPTERNTLPQVFNPATATWRDLTGALDSPPSYVLYPQMFLAPDGRVFKAGPDAATGFLDTSGTGAWTAGPPRAVGNRDYGSAVTYDGRVLVIGGGSGVDNPDPPTASVEVIDLNASPASWSTQAAMAFRRRHHTATVLPTGEILVTGGTSSPGFSNAAEAVLAAEIFDPETNRWTTMGSMSVRRVYHSTALLLSDGRVLVAGGGRPPADGDVDHRNAEIFSPPYLFKGPRPAITAAPTTMTAGQTYFVQTADASAISKVTLIRLGSVTHAFDQNQRLATLAFSSATTGLSVTAPGANVTPPGHYLLSIVNSDGVPSVSSIVQVVGAAFTTHPASQTATKGQTVSFTAIASGAPTYQWQVSTDRGASWTDLTNAGSYSGATSATLVVTRATVAMNGNQYRCLVANSAASPTSDPATLAVVSLGVDLVADFDGDRRTDIGVYRPSTGGWFVLRSVDTVPFLIGWGCQTCLDLSVPGDYDGDGKADVAVYRDTTGEWFVRHSAGGTTTLGWGAPSFGDVPVPADYDGDGMADLAVYRSTTGEWFVRRSGDGGLSQLGWGAPTLQDIPVPADYDGDGRTDIAVYRRTTGEWFVRRSGDGGLTHVGWGAPTLVDVPVPADYDGDGQADIAVYRQTAGEWFIRRSGDGGLTQLGWGAPTLQDVPVAADYDGDGQADIAVYRKTTGEWFIRQSAMGYPGPLVWGNASDDTPLTLP